MVVSPGSSSWHLKQAKISCRFTRRGSWWGCKIPMPLVGSTQLPSIGDGVFDRTLDLVFDYPGGAGTLRVKFRVRFHDRGKGTFKRKFTLDE